MSPAAARMARSRERAVQGRAVLQVEVDIIGLAYWLRKEELIDGDHDDDRKLLSVALERAIAISIAKSLRVTDNT